jgi:hypothetical protein
VANIVFKSKSAAFSGEIVLKPVGFDDKYRYIEEMDILESGEKSTKAQVSIVRKMVQLSKDHYVKVDMTKVSTGEKLSSFDDLSNDEDGHAVLIEVATGMFSGFRVGNA